MSLENDWCDDWCDDCCMPIGLGPCAGCLAYAATEDDMDDDDDIFDDDEDWIEEV